MGDATSATDAASAIHRATAWLRRPRARAVADTRRREFTYAIVAEPDVFVLYKTYTNNIGTVRLAEFKTRRAVDAFVDTLPAARRVYL
jgi:hypothetical protein